MVGRLSEQAHVALTVIFGSYARGEATASSDLDFLVLPASTAAFDTLGFEAAAQHIVGRQPVDLTVLRPELSSALAWEALRDAVPRWEETQGTYQSPAPRISSRNARPVRYSIPSCAYRPSDCFGGKSRVFSEITHCALPSFAAAHSG